jgi:hypothetical protein
VIGQDNSAREAKDRPEIEALMWHYARALDTGDGAAYAATYTVDGQFGSGANATKGREALKKLGDTLKDQQATAKAKQTVERVKELRSQSPPTPQPLAPPKPAPTIAQTNAAEQKIDAALAKLSPADRELAVAQKFCAINNEGRLGSMGPPVKIVLNGEPVFLCCEGCEQTAKDDPAATLARVKQLRTANQPKSSASTIPGESR